MGQGRMASEDWSRYTKTIENKSRNEIFSSTNVPDDLDPAKFLKVRESRDSAENPQSNAILIGADVTGSMGMIAEELVRRAIGTTFEEILARAAKHDGKMITDPHLMVMGIGDVQWDRGPVQMTQFEADIRIAEQLQRIWLEGRGGNNEHESYDVAWYAGAKRTSIDCFEKRNRKGYLFTVGDECAPVGLTQAQIKRFFGDDVQSDFSAKELLEMAQQTYHVFHVVIEQGNYARNYLDRVRKTWGELLPQNTLFLADSSKLAQVVVSAIQANEGVDLSEVVNSWGEGDTALVVSRTLGKLVPASLSNAGGPIRF